VVGGVVSFFLEGWTFLSLGPIASHHLFFFFHALVGFPSWIFFSNARRLSPSPFLEPHLGLLLRSFRRTALAGDAFFFD